MQFSTTDISSGGSGGAFPIGKSRHLRFLKAVTESL
jgi:hypothetical protein